MTLPNILHTPRLLLRKPELEDAKAIHEAVLETFDDLKPWMGWAQHIPTLEETITHTSNSNARWGFGENRMLIFDKETNEFIGSTGFIRYDTSVPKYEIGYWCRNSKKQNGYIKEAVLALTKAAFEHCMANRVEIKCDVDNYRSKKVAESLGFNYEGCHTNDGLKADRLNLRSTAIYAVTNKDQLNG